MTPAESAEVMDDRGDLYTRIVGTECEYWEPSHRCDVCATFLDRDEILGIVRRVAAMFDLGTDAEIGIMATGGGCDHPGICAVPPNRADRDYPRENGPEYVMLVSDDCCEAIYRGEHPPRLMIGGGERLTDRLGFVVVPNHPEPLAAAVGQWLTACGFERVAIR